jgi:phosphogluconate dehydratase
MDAEQGILEALVPAEEWAQRQPLAIDLTANHVGMGRELFAMFRTTVSAAEEGATSFGLPPVLHNPEAAAHSEQPQKATI